MIFHEYLGNLNMSGTPESRFWNRTKNIFLETDLHLYQWHGVIGFSWGVTMEKKYKHYWKTVMQDFPQRSMRTSRNSWTLQRRKLNLLKQLRKIFVHELVHLKVKSGKHKSTTETSHQSYSKYFKKDSSTLSLSSLQPPASNVDVNHPQHIKGLKLFLYSTPELVTDETPSFNAISAIMESCQKTKKSVEFIEETTGHLFKYTLYIEGRCIVESFSANKKEAKRQCAEKAVIYLKQYQEIIFKDQIDHDKVTEIDKKNLVKDSYLSAPKISADNMGSKLLKKMGWDGSSGVGKFSHGISEPVFVESVENRAGFGHSFDDRSVRKGSVETTLLNFLREPSQTEIKFSRDLTKEDRALVHRLCTKYHLKHKSFGKNEDRYLLVTKSQIF